MVPLADEYIVAYIHGMRVHSKYCGTACQYLYSVIDLATTVDDRPNANPSWSIGDGDRLELSPRWDICVAGIST